MAMIGDSFPLAVRQVAMSRYIGATLIGQLVGVSVGGMVAEWIGWRGVLGCAAVLAAIAAGAAMMMLPQPQGHRRLSRAFRTPLPAIAGPGQPAILCVLCDRVSGRAGNLRHHAFIGEHLRSRGAGGLREAGFVIGGLGIGGLLYAFAAPLILKFAKRPAMMASGGSVAAMGLATAGLDVLWAAQMASMVVLGFGFFLLHNSVQTEVTELAPPQGHRPSPCTPSASSWDRRSGQSRTGQRCRHSGRQPVLPEAL
jgi:predicted MFS family arabinose efflux permease